MLTNSIPSQSYDESSLTLNYSGGFDIQNDRVIINIPEIANHRSLDNISGTLSIELWALDAPYSGGYFNGFALAGTRIGVLMGQNNLLNCLYDLSFQEPPVGTWYLCLMIREWTDNAFVTRDAINFALPYVVSHKATIERIETSNVINVSFVDHKKTSVIVADEKKVVSNKVKGSKADNDKASNNLILSLNTASLKELTNVKGISKKLAENILAERPFNTLNDVLKVKGMGPKLWQKLSEFVTFVG